MTVGPPLIRPATATDADEVFRLATVLATSAAPERAAFEISYGQGLADDRQVLLVADCGDGSSGYVQGLVHPAFHANGDVAWVEELVVDASARSAGLGRLLMAGFEDWARAAGQVSYVALATRRASDFYLSLGYEESATYFKKVS